jgi:hypothetical protein
MQWRFPNRQLITVYYINTYWLFCSNFVNEATIFCANAFLKLFLTLGGGIIAQARDQASGSGFSLLNQMPNLVWVFGIGPWA